MVTPWERGYRKIADLEELTAGTPVVYRTGGTAILLLLTRFGVSAADATGHDDAALDDATCAAIFEDRSLPVRIHEREVWVCVDA